MSRQAIEALILDKVLAGYNPGQADLSPTSIDSYISAVADVRFDAIAKAAEQFQRGLVDGRNADYPPTAPAFSAQARKWQDAMNLLDSVRSAPRLVRYDQGALPPPDHVPLGVIEEHEAVPVDQHAFAPRLQRMTA